MRGHIVLRRCLQILPVFYFARFGFEWRWLALSFVSYVFLARIGIDLGYHRYFVHGAFPASRRLRRFLLVSGAMALRGSVISWAIVHRQHHIHADTRRDPQPGLHHLPNWHPRGAPEIDLGPSLGLMKDPWVRFFHKHYLAMALVFVAIFAAPGMKALVYGYCLPLAYASFAFNLTNIVCHRWGYRAYETADLSTNNLLVHLLTVGGGLHNNHHGRPTDLSQRLRWYEVDFFIPFWRVVLWWDQRPPRKRSISSQI